MWPVGGQVGADLIKLGQMAISPELHPTRRPGVWQHVQNFLRGGRTYSSSQAVVVSPVISPDVVKPIQDIKELDKLLLAQMEEALESPMRAKAEKIKEELEGCGVPRGLMLIIDDSAEKIELMERKLAKHARSTGINYVIDGETDGQAGIVLYERLSEIAPGEKVVVFIDGQLAGQILDRGEKVARRLVEVTRRNGLSMPFIVGESSIDEWNDDIRRAVDPAVYLGEFNHSTFRSRRTLSAIDNILSAA